jgi:O-antigen ligase
VLTFAVLSGPLPKLGMIAVALLAGVVLLARDDGTRAWAMLGALILSPVLLLAQIWHSPQLGVIHRHPLVAVVAAAFALAALAAAAVLLFRRPRLLAPLAVAVVPFRIPIQAGGSTGAANLLVPLYFVVAAAALAWLVPVLWERRDGGIPGTATASPPERYGFERLLAGFLVLYAVQALYSLDFQAAMDNMVFFYVPFALLLARLRELDWDRELVTQALVVTAVLAVALACIGFYEEATRTTLFSSKLAYVNDTHAPFTVNSVFYDSNIFGRYMALVMILLVAVLLYDRRPRVLIAVTVTLAVVWGGLVLALSRSSLVALLVGMGTLAAVRWRATKPVLGVAAAVVVIGAIAVAVSPNTYGLNQGLNGASSGRANLVTGGISMFGSRPLWGYGSGSFVTEYQSRYPQSTRTVSASHTIPITVAAEQGLIGLVVYLALVISALLALFKGVRDDPVRLAVAATFLALVAHTMLYADFLEDPITWTLLGIGSALVTASRTRRTAEQREAERARRAARATASTVAGAP